MASLDSLDSILGNVKTNADVPKDHKPKNGLDVKNIKLPDSYVESILQFSAKAGAVGIREAVEPVIEEQEVQEINESLIESKVTDLVAKLGSLLKEAKVVIEEMTSCGMIGTNQKFVLGKKGKKNGPPKTNKRN